MKKNRSILVAVAFVLAASCAKASPNLSPTGRAAFQAIKAVQVLDVIRDFAVAANDQTPPIIARNDMRTIVEFHAQAVRTIRAVPEGWKPAVLQALMLLQDNVPAATWDKLKPYVALLTVVIQEVP